MGLLRRRDRFARPLIAKGTGEKLFDYARRVLFEPLDFGPSE
jgi:hypothetical protein